MSIWVIIMGSLITLNCLLAWASLSHGSKCLSMWLGVSYGLGLLLTIATRLMPDWTIFDYPWQNFFMSVADLALLGWLLVVLKRNDDLKDSAAFLIGLQCLSLFSHWVDLSTLHHMKRIYYGALDVIEGLMIVLNIRKSAQYGIHLDTLLPWLRPVHPHRGRNG